MFHQMRAINEIKTLRRKFHLTQKELADKAGVSQSLVAKIEAGRQDPSYTNAQKIFAALHSVEESKELKAKDVMHKGVLFSDSKDKVKEIISVMKRKGISQVPVMEREKVVGVITENTILNQLAESPETISTATVGEIMEDVPPIVSLTMGMKTLVELLKDYPIVLVGERGEIKGIVSKSDLLGKI